ncbi:serine hydrolase domain-containing protein [Aquimarina algicola]|uniref:Serine hydrolase n=1 Tax=Aquimarina algicola TaxID=2589995 RepID=A0A504J8K6_9FLAO|nr:serine hydrolase domain-containing protein [Aquimarina algicola]TPN86914.1 serine hydrolase [Aquimarina algicola]
MKNKIYQILFAVILISCQNQKRDDNTSTSGYDELNTSLVKKLNQAYSEDLIKGFAVTIVNDKGTVFEKGFGFANIDTTYKYTSKTTQPVASISKVLIGLSLIKAEELNLLSLEDPINKYLPFPVVNPNFPDTEILVKHLAYHTSSIIDQDEIYLDQFFLEKDIERSDHEAEDYYEFFRKANEKKSLENYLEDVFSKKRYKIQPYSDNKPGEVREYSNIGSDLCALLLQKVAKQDFRDFTAKYILKPLQMKSSGWRPEEMVSSNRSRLFVSKDMMITNYVQGSYPNGSFRSCSHDLGLLLSELIRGYNGKGRILSKEGFARFYQKQYYDGQFYGCFIEYNNNWIHINDKMVGHDGSDPGVFTGMFFSPKRNTGKIIISNTDTDYLGDKKIWEEISNIWKALIQYETECIKI